MSRESKEFVIQDKDTLESRIKEAVTTIKFIEGIDMEENEKKLYNLIGDSTVSKTLEKDIGQPLLENLKKVLGYLEDPEMQEIIRVNEYRMGDKEEDIVGNFMGFVLPALRRIIKKGVALPQDQDFLNLLDRKTKDFLEYLEHLSKAKLRVA